MVTAESYVPNAPMSIQCFTDVKVHFEKKNSVLPIEKFPFLVLARNTMMLQHLIVQFLLCYLLSGGLQEVKSKDIFTLLALKVVDVAYDR